MRGDLSETSHDALLGALADARTSGRLVLDGPDGEGVVIFQDGWIVDARSPAPRAQLLPRLVATDGLAPADAAAIAARTDGGRDEDALLEALHHDGGVDPEVLLRLRVEQVLDAVSELLAWRFGTYLLLAAPALRPDARHPHLSAADVLAEAGRRRARLDELAGLLPSLEVIPSPEPDRPATLDIGADPNALLGAIDGRRDLRTLAEELGFGGLEVLRLVAGLHALGLVRVAAPEDEVGAAWDDVLAMSALDGDDAGPDRPEEDRPSPAPGTPSGVLPHRVATDPTPPASEPTHTELSEAAVEALAATERSDAPAEEDADVAAFLRELSSLALSDRDDEAQTRRARGSGPSMAPPERSSDGRPSDAEPWRPTQRRRDPEPPRKRRGLFGRGS